MKEPIRIVSLGCAALSMIALAGCFSRTVKETNTTPPTVVEPAPSASTTTTTTTGNGEVERQSTTTYSNP